MNLQKLVYKANKRTNSSLLVVNNLRVNKDNIFAFEVDLINNQLTLSSEFDIFARLKGRFNSLDGTDGTENARVSRIIYLDYSNLKTLKKDVKTILTQIL